MLEVVVIERHGIHDALGYLIAGILALKVLVQVMLGYPFYLRLRVEPAACAHEGL